MWFVCVLGFRRLFLLLSLVIIAFGWGLFALSSLVVGVIGDWFGCLVGLVGWFVFCLGFKGGI